MRRKHGNILRQKNLCNVSNCNYNYDLCPIVSISCQNNNIGFSPGSCTIFATSYGEKTLFGNSEDYNDPETYCWVEPRSEGNYGRVYVGYGNFYPQGGINEKGLAMDGNALPPSALNLHPELPPPNESVLRTIMKKAANVEKAIEIAVKYRRDNGGIPMRYQIFLADANGDAVVMSAGADGELAFTRKEEGDGYLVSTNFNRANPENGEYPCWRYDTVVWRLDEIENEDDLKVDYFKSILDAVHIESPYDPGISIQTLYSNIFDLRNGVIYLYYWGQFDEVMILDVEELINEGTFLSRIEDLFSEETYEGTSTGTDSSGGCFIATAAFEPFTCYARR